MAERTPQQSITLPSKVDFTDGFQSLGWTWRASRTPDGVGWGEGEMAEEENLLFDLEILVGGVFVAVDLHVGYVSLFGSRGDGAGLLNLEYVSVI